MNLRSYNALWALLRVSPPPLPPPRNLDLVAWTVTACGTAALVQVYVVVTYKENLV